MEEMRDSSARQIFQADLYRSDLTLSLAAHLTLKRGAGRLRKRTPYVSKHSSVVG